MPRRNTSSAPGSGAMRAAIWPPVKVSTSASEPPLLAQRLQDHAFERVVVLGQDEIAEPLAHLGDDRRELALDVGLVGAAHGQLGLDLRVMGAEAELDAAVRHQFLDPGQQLVDMRLAEPIGMKALQLDRGLARRRAPGGAG